MKHVKKYKDCKLIENENKLHNFKMTTIKKLNPSVTRRRACTMLLLTNLIFPQWVSVNCAEPLLSHVVCFTRQNSVLNSTSNPQAYEAICDDLAIKNLSKCFNFLWYDGDIMVNTMAKDICKLHKMYLSLMNNFETFNFLFESTAEVKFHLLFRHPVSPNHLEGLMYERIWLTRKYNKKPVHANHASGYLVCKTNTEPLLIKNSNTFRCKTGGFISSLYICDGTNDCSPIKSLGTDEVGCLCNSVRQVYKSNCRNLTSFCSPLHYMTKDRKCSMYLNQHIYQHTTKDEEYKFSCQNNITLVDLSLLDDLIPHCEENYLDESLLKIIVKNKTYIPCPMKGQLPCKTGHPKCYNISEICIYRLDKHNNLYPCKTGAHIQKCDIFECHQHFKCLKYYCIPWSYICDGKWDCPDGYDETHGHVCGKERICVNQFKCKNSEVCIHIHDICNDFLDCPLHDDEVLCPLKDVICPKSCECLNYALMCNEITTDFLSLQYLPHVAYHLVAVSLVSLSFLEQKKHVMVLNVSRNYIEVVCNSNTFSKHIQKVDFSWNLIQNISKKCFENLANLHEIKLNRNKISLLKPKSFYSLKTVSIDLSSNSLQCILKGAFYNISMLYLLQINDNPLTQVHFQNFIDVHVRILQTSDFYICCITSHLLACLVSKTWHMTCSNLLPSFSIKFAFVTVSIFVVTLNLLSLWQKYTTISRRPQGKVFNVIVCFINAGDFMYGVYLVIIWIADSFYGKSFVNMHHIWKSGQPCFLAFTFVLLFSFLVPYFLGLLSLARLMVVKYPLHSKFRSCKFVIKYSKGGLITLGIIVLSMTIYLGSQYKIPNYLCLPFVDPDDNVPEIKFLTGIVAVWQFLVFSFIAIIYGILVALLMKTEKNDFLQGKRTDKHIIFQLVFLSALNMICFLPSSVIFLTLLQLPKYPIILPFWTTVALVPSNSMVNPLLFTFLSKKRSKSIQKALPTRDAARSVTEISWY